MLYLSNCYDINKVDYLLLTVRVRVCGVLIDVSQLTAAERDAVLKSLQMFDDGLF